MTCTKCNRAPYKLDLCKMHFNQRTKIYRYLGHKQMLVTEQPKPRICLSCDRKFESFGNRRCDLCNSNSNCHYESETSNFIRV